MIIKRGEIYFVEMTMGTQGCEYSGGRPAIIVSNNKGNEFSDAVEVVYLTSKPKKPMPTHVPIMCDVPSTALCEQVYTVSKERLGGYKGRCSDAEMAEVDKALLVSLGIETEVQPTVVVAASDQSVEQAKLETERNLYKQLYNSLLEKITG